MGPVMLRATSDHPILELLVRSTGGGKLRLAGWKTGYQDINLTFVLVPVSDVMEIIHSGIVVVLSRKHDSIQISGMSISDRVSYIADSTS